MVHIEGNFGRVINNFSVIPKNILQISKSYIHQKIMNTPNKTKVRIHQRKFFNNLNRLDSESNLEVRSSKTQD